MNNTKTTKTTKKQIHLYGCRGYSYNIFTELMKVNEKTSKDIIKFFVDLKQPTDKENTINISNYTFQYNDFNNLKENDINNNKNPLLIQIYNKGLNIPRLSFVIKNNYIYVSWSSKPCELKNKFTSHTVKKLKKEKIIVKKNKVSNIYEKLNQLIKEPSYSLLNKLFKYENKGDADTWLKTFKNSRIVVYSLIKH
jgi:hypothetical protein